MTSKEKLTSLASGLYEIGTAERLDECIIARKYCDCGELLKEEDK